MRLRSKQNSRQRARAMSGAGTRSMHSSWKLFLSSQHKWLGLFRRSSGRGWKLELSVIDGNVGFNLLNSDFGPRIRIVLGTAFNGVREHNSIDRFVRAQSGHAFTNRPADELLGFNLDFKKCIGIEEIVAYVTVLQCDFELVSIVSVHLVVAQILNLVALFVGIHQGAVKVGRLDEAPALVITHELRVLLAAERRDLPRGAAVIGLDLGHALKSEGGPIEFGTLALTSE